MTRLDNLSDWIFTFIGGISIFLCTSSLIPQTYRMIKTKKTNDISKIGLFINFSGIVLNIVYSVYFELWELFVPEVMALLLVLVQLFLKRCYDYDEALGLLDKQLLDEENVNESPVSSNMDLDDRESFKVY